MSGNTIATTPELLPDQYYLRQVPRWPDRASSDKCLLSPWLPAQLRFSDIKQTVPLNIQSLGTTSSTMSHYHIMFKCGRSTHWYVTVKYHTYSVISTKHTT